MKTYFLVVASLLLGMLCSLSPTFGQQASRYVPNQIPASPEAASLGKFVEVPVNLYQGLPQISIPIHEFKVGSLSVPVVLKYHASGFRMSENASSVGMGWTLEAGGTLSRTLRGLDDESAYGYLTSNDARWFFNSVGYPKLTETLNPNSTSYNNVTLSQVNATGVCDLMDKHLKGERDTEPDLYTFSAPGFSGKFVYNLDGKVHFIPHQNASIYSDAGPTQAKNLFMLTSAQGIEYTFGTGSPSGYLTGYVERNKSNVYSYLFFNPPTSVPNPEYIYNSTWHLSRIGSKNSLEDVQFEYEPQTVETVALTNQSSALAVTNGGMLAQNNLLDWQETKTKTITEGGRLKKITGPEGIEINFIYETAERKDLKGGHRLKTIEIKKYGVLIKKYELTHSYFGDISAYETCYLKLDRVQQLSPQGDEMPPYLLTYYQDEFGNYFPTPIGKNSYAQDEWGFYNAQNINSPLFLPTIKIYPSATYPGGVYSKMANREINEAVNHCGMLTKIQYPTGGYHEIVYEQNEYRLATNQTHYEQIKHNWIASTGITHIYFTQQGSVKKQRVPFTISSQTGNKWVYVETEGYDPQTLSGDCYTAIENSSGQLTYNPSGFVSLAPGDYYLVARTDTVYCVGGEIPTIKIEYENDGTQIYSKKTGGVRIKNIKTHDGVSTNNDIYKAYEYVDNQGVSTGRLNMLPTYHYLSSFTDGSGTTGTMLNISAFTPSVANHLGYVEVHESFGKKHGNAILSNALGKKVYTYTHPSGDPVPLIASPKMESQTPTHYNGRLLSETVYDKQGRKLTEKLNTYTHEDIQTVYGVRAAISASYVNPCSGGNPVQTYDFAVLQEKSDWSELLQTVERNYSFTTGSSTASTYQEITTNYDYDDQTVNNQKTYFLREKSTQNSEGKTIATKYKYPFDFSGTDFDNIQPRYTTPIETTELKNGKIVGGTLTKFYNINGYSAPKEIYALDLASPMNGSSTNFSTYSSIPSPYKLKAIFNYDEFLRLENVKDEQEQEQSFIRVNQGSDRMVANIAGAALNRVAYMGMEPEKEGYHFTVASGNQEQGSAFSGNYYVKAGAVVTSATMPVGRYLLTFYTKGQGSVNINVGSQSVSGTTSTDWQYQQLELNITSAGTVVITPASGVALDEIRLHPVSSQMTSRTYYPWGGIRDVIDVKGQKLTYEYDNFLRLKAIRDLDGNIIKTWNYHYKN